jgi:hypothetical protein
LLSRVRHSQLAVNLATAAAVAGCIAAAAVVPTTATVVIAGVCLLSFAVGAARRLPAIFLSLLCPLLAAYAFFGRGAAYAGYSPIFVGELVLGFGLLALLLGSGLTVMRSPLAWLLVAFMAWGAARTLPYVDEYGSAALRDAVVWGYAGFALLVGSYLLRTGLVWRVPGRYMLFARALPFWVPVAWAVTKYAEPAIPTWPHSEVPVLVFKPGDGAVHLGGALAFILLGLQLAPGKQGGRESWRRWIWWTAWVAAAAIVAAASRSALLSIIAAASTVILVRPHTSVWRPVLVTVAVAAVLVVGDTSIQVRHGRALSASQVRQNVSSISEYANATGKLGGTVLWRLSWWRDIVGYTVSGPYFWFGKGYGINLADADGYQLDPVNHSLRSPHNGHLTILARSGVPGLALWALLQLTFGLSLARGYVRLRRIDRGWWPRVYLWTLAYWSAFVVNSTFDVFLEGPQGGIWFWCVFGFGLAVIEAGKERLNRKSGGTRMSATHFHARPRHPGTSPVGAVPAPT